MSSVAIGNILEGKSILQSGHIRKTENEKYSLKTVKTSGIVSEEMSNSVSACTAYLVSLNYIVSLGIPLFGSLKTEALNLKKAR